MGITSRAFYPKFDYFPEPKLLGFEQNANEIIP